MKKFQIPFLICLFAYLLICLFCAPPARAQSVDLGLYPPVFQIQTTPPASMKLPFFIQNFADTSVDLSISLKPFTAASSENGAVSFLDNADSLADPSLLQNIQVLDNADPIQAITLAPKQKKNLTLTVDIPSNEVKGEYYIALIFTSSKQNNFNSSFSEQTVAIASNILLSIGPLGPTRGYIADFSTTPFITKGPVAFNVRLKNNSDHYITPKGDIVIANIFGQKVGKVELLPVNILSNTLRRMPDAVQKDPNNKNYAIVKAIADKNQFPVAVWPEKFLFGPYTATLTIALSDTGPLYKKTILFLAFPSEYLLAIIVVIMVVTFIILRVRQKIS